MSDDELIARLRQHDGWVTLEAHTHLTAADRIEALIEESGRRLALARSEGVARVEQFEQNEALTEQLNAARQDAKEAEAYAEELEAKLAKAVDLAIEECPFRHGTPRYNDWWHHRRATLAEIKGESHEALPDLR